MNKTNKDKLQVVNYGCSFISMDETNVTLLCASR